MILNTSVKLKPTEKLLILTQGIHVSTHPDVNFKMNFHFDFNFNCNFNSPAPSHFRKQQLSEHVEESVYR